MAMKKYWVVAAIALLSASAAFGADGPPGRTIAYAFTDLKWAVYESKDGKEECPSGMSALGPREQYKLQFPDDGTERKLVDTELAREADIWWPTTAPDKFGYREAVGNHAIGLNLDGKVKPTNFMSPEGAAGVDYQLFHVIGCIGNYREGAAFLNIEQTFYKKMRVNRLLIEVTDVDSMINDDDVTVTVYRGQDALLSDATGKGFLPGSTERLDLHWGKEFIRKTKGKIVYGVLRTDPVDLSLPREISYQEATVDWLRDGRFEVRLMPDRAEGVIGGYADIESIYNNRNRSVSTHHSSIGQQAPASFYKELRKYADAYPDPETGENTAISAAYAVKMVRVQVLRLAQ